MRYESLVEKTIISLLKEKGYNFLQADDYWLENRKYYDFINKELFFLCMKKINNIYDNNILENLYNKITRIDNPSLFERNYIFHNYLVNGITVDSKDYKINPYIKLIDFENPHNNIFQVTNQIKYKESSNIRIPDIVIYINGLPLIVMELKTFDENAFNTTIEDAYNQLGSNSENNGYRYDIPTLFNYNTFLVISDSINTKIGTITSKLNRYTEWKSVNGERGYDDNCVYKLNILIDGLFNKQTLLDVVKNNLFFIKDKNEKPLKIITQYHQYFGVKKAYDSIIKAQKPNGNGKAGILWHTQGSGKSFSMVMLAKRLLNSSLLKVPTIVILTDRIDLDQQLYKTFFSAKDYLKTEPIIAISRNDLVEKLSKIKQGGIILTTVGKFDKDNLPKNERNNIIVMTDEAHRGHYGLYETIYFEKNKETEELEAVSRYGIEKYIRDALPNATFIGFTGTPISTEKKQTVDIFGDIIDVYDMTQSIIDGSTVKLFFDSRHAGIWTNDFILKEIDNYYNYLKNNEKADENSIEKSKSLMSSLKILLEEDSMINTFAKDIISHYNEKKDILNGKAMIVCQTRTAALKLYKKIIELDNNLKDKTILVVTESNKDDEEQRQYFKNSEYRKELANEFKKDTSKYKIAIVCDMWLTGFDVPDLEIMYIIKKMRSHNLMQTLARVNRVYQGKNSGLIVDYIGLENALQEALNEYTHRDRDNTCNDIRLTIYKLLQEKLEELNTLFKDINRSNFYSDNVVDKFSAIQKGTEFIISNKDLENYFMNDLSFAVKKAFVVCAGILTQKEKNDSIYYLAIRSYILKLKNKPSLVSIKDMNEYVSNLLKEAIRSDEVKILTKNTEKISNIIEILSSDKIKELRDNNPPFVFLQILKSILEKAIHYSRNNNYLKSQEYSKKLRKILEKYNDRDIDFNPELTIAKLVDFAVEILKDEKEVEKLGIYGRERAFYDALVKDIKTEDLLKDETLKLIAKELSEVVEENSKTDWTNKESTRATMRIKIKECLRKYNYPKNYIDDAVNNVYKQAEFIVYD